MGTIYRPKHVRQLLVGDKYGGTNCTASSAAMAIDRATMGGIQVTGKTVRAASNEPIPDPASPGLNLPQVVNVAFGWHVELQNRTGAPWFVVIKSLKEGRGIVLQGDYDQIPPGFSGQLNFKGDHAVYVNHVTGDGDLYWQDPLRSAAVEIPEAVARAYAEKFARTVGTFPGVLFATTRVTPNVA